MWELLKRFPTLPPFGKKWFSVLQEPFNPVAIIRLEWIYLSIADDRRRELEQRKDEIEYGGLFSGPEIYSHVKGFNRDKGSLEVIRETAEYDKKFDAAVRGEVAPTKRRTDVAMLVSRKRDEMKKQGKSLPKIEPQDPFADEGYDDDDDSLIIEEPE